MKKIFIILLTMIMICFLSSCGSSSKDAKLDSSDHEQDSKPNANKSSNSNKALVGNAGETACYGNYDGKPIEWICLVIEGEKALLITKDCIRLDIFNEPSDDGSQVLWADSTLRSWLNGEFLDSLSPNEQAMLVETEFTCNDNMGFSDYPEEEVEWKNTLDKVFLLSAKEINAYFPSDESRIAGVYLSPDEQETAIVRYSSLFNYERSSGEDTIKQLNGGPVEYWLRTNGRGYMVQTVDSDGRYSDYGSNPDASYKGVRPAVWVNLSFSPK